MIDILDLNIKSKFATNGTEPLTGSIGSYMEATIDFIVHWEAENIDASFVGNSIIANDGTNFLNNGFKVGDTITVTDGLTSGSAGNAGNYTILNISADGSTMYVGYSDSTSGSVIFTTQIGVDASIYGTTPITAIDFYYGLVENSGTPAYTSLIDGETQKYRATGLDADALGTETLVPQTLNKSWLTGSTSEQALNVIQEAGIGTSGVSTGYEQRFTITHVFHLSPAILDNWEDSGGELDIANVSWFNLGNALKYIPKIVAGYSTSGTEHDTDSGNLSSFLQNGDTGFYDEYRNGGAVNYTLGSISYEGGDRTEFSKNITTDVSIVIEKVSGNYSADHRFDVYVFQLPDDTTEYSNITTDVWTNFEVSNIFVQNGSVAQSDNLISAGACTTSTNQATITFTYAASGNDRKYLIFVDVGELSTNQSTNDHHAVLIDYNQFAKYIDMTDGLIIDNTLVNEHSTNDTGKAYTDAKTWVEDGILCTTEFYLKKTVGVSDEYDQTLNEVTVSITCEHATDSTRNFTLESLTYSNPTNTTRGYYLYSGDPKNDFTFNEQTATTDYRIYIAEYATKIRWMNWSTLGVADPDFTTATENWSIYNLPPDWQLYINIQITSDLEDSSTGDTDTYVRTHKTELYVKNYDEYDGCEKTGEINTYLASDSTDLSGKLSKTANTTVIASFYGYDLFPCIYNDITSGSGSCQFDEILSGSGSYSNGEGNLVNCPDYYGILELDIPNSGGTTVIRQISTVITDTESPSPWIGEVATNAAKLIAYPYASPPRIDVIATLDYTQLNTSIGSYNLSARLGKNAQTICTVSIHAHFGQLTGEYTNSALSGFTTDEILVFDDGKEETSINVATLSGSTLSFNPTASRHVKICCSKDAITGTTSGAGQFTDASLVGLTSDDFLCFVGSNGREGTTVSSFTFNSGTGTIGGMPINQPIKISFHVAADTDNIAAPASTYTNAILANYDYVDIMIFIDGYEQYSLGSTLSGSTLTMGTAVSGNVKIVEVNQ